MKTSSAPSANLVPIRSPVVHMRLALKAFVGGCALLIEGMLLTRQIRLVGLVRMKEVARGAARRGLAARMTTLTLADRRKVQDLGVVLLDRWIVGLRQLFADR